MIKAIEALQTSASISDRIIVALDVPTPDAARSIAAELRGQVGAFKIGLQLFTASGPSFVRELVDSGDKVFLDLKFHDIPNTVAKAAVEAARLGVWMFDIHASAGSETMRRTVGAVNEVCIREELERPLIIGITVLTSADDDTLRENGIERPITDQVVSLATLAAESGLDGVVASPLESPVLRRQFPTKSFQIVTPGIRGTYATTDDQKRVTTVREAFANGSDYVVIGRPIIGAADRLQAVEAILTAA